MNKTMKSKEQSTDLKIKVVTQNTYFLMFGYEPNKAWYHYTKKINDATMSKGAKLNGQSLL